MSQVGSPLTGTRLFLRARFVVTALTMALLTALITARWSTWVGELSLNDQHLPRFLPLIELAPALYGIMVVTAFRPRLTIWERLQARRLRWHTASTAVLCLALPQIILLAGVSTLPVESGRSWTWIATNVLILTATSLILVALTGPLRGTAITLGGYAAIIAVQQTLPGWLPALPITNGSHPQPRWFTATAIALIAAALWTATAGGTIRSAPPDDHDSR